MPEPKTKGPKTRPTTASVDEFLNTIPDPRVREDCRTISTLMQAAAKAPPVMWGTGIVGFGTVDNWPNVAFSPRKQNIVLYLMNGLDRNPNLLSALGKHKRSKGCLYLNRLSDIHLPTLKKLVAATAAGRTTKPRTAE